MFSQSWLALLQQEKTQPAVHNPGDLLIVFKGNFCQGSTILQAPVWCVALETRPRPSSSCWGGWCSWVLTLNPLSKSFHGVRCCHAVLHIRHWDGSHLGPFNVKRVETTAEIRPKSSSSFCKLPLVNTSGFLELSRSTFLLSH